MDYQKITYKNLNHRQKERYNFQKVSGLLADYGFSTIKLDDDWQNADFIAQHIDGTFVKVQLKSRLTFDKKYVGKGIWICFPHNDSWFFFDHDKVMHEFLNHFPNKMAVSKSWTGHGGYSWPGLSKVHLKILDEHKL